MSKSKKKIFPLHNNAAIFNDVVAFFAALATPPGFSKETYTETGWDMTSTPAPAVVFRNLDAEPGTEIKLIMDPKPTEYELQNSFGIRGSGHTTFYTSKGRMTFDRRGVDDSFYVTNRDDVESVNATIAAQIARVAESRARLATCLTMPKYGYNVTPEILERDRDLLKRGLVARYAPAGFGTGHFFARSRNRVSRYAVRADKTVEDFFAVGPLFVETFDHD